MSRASASDISYVEAFIAELQMVAAAVGLQARDYAPFASAFAAFSTRAFDCIRMAAISRANLRCAVPMLALQAHAEMARIGVDVRVIDAYSLKPIETANVRRAARDTGVAGLW